MVSCTTLPTSSAAYAPIDVIIVAAHLLLHFRDEVMDGVNHEEHWTADLREIVFEKPPMSENRRPGFPQKMLAPLGMSETYFSL